MRIWPNVDSIAVPGRGIVLHAGGGSDGEYGYAAVSHAATNELIWLAFVERSNPFEAIALDGEIVRATTNLDLDWCFPLDEPEKVRVVAARPRSNRPYY